MPAIALPVREQQQVHYLPRAEVDPWALDEPTIAQPTRYIDHCLPQDEVDPWAPDEPAVARPARYIDYAGLSTMYSLEVHISGGLQMRTVGLRKMVGPLVKTRPAVVK